MKKILLLISISSALCSSLPAHATTYFDTRALFASPSAPTQDLIAANSQGEFDYIRVGTLSQSISAADLYVTVSVPISNSCTRLNGLGSGSFPFNFFLQPFTDSSLQTPLTGNSVDASFGIRALPDGTCVTKFDNITLPSGSYIVLALGLLPQFVDRLNPWPLTVTAGGTWESVPPFCSGGAGINNCVAYSGTPYILITDVNPFPERAPLGTTYLDTRGLFVATSPAQDLNLVNPTDGGVIQDSSITLGTISTDISGQSDYYLNFSAPFPNSCATIVTNLQPSGTSFFNIAYFTSDGAYFLGHDDVADNDIKNLPDGTCVAHFRAINMRNAGTLVVLQVRHFYGGYLIASFPLIMTSGGTWTGPLSPYCGLHCRHYSGTLYTQLSDNTSTVLPPDLSVSPLAIDFDRQIIGMPSPTKNVTIQNSGGGILVPIFNISGDFSQSNNCATGMSAGQTCQVKISFIPSEPGTRHATLSINSALPVLNERVVLNGVGTLAFPLKGSIPDINENLTAATAEINSVFDHSMQNVQGEYAIYDCDKKVVDFVNEIGNEPPAQKIGSRCEKAYSQTNGNSFEVNGHYRGAGSPTMLLYDGHPGYDYQSKFYNQVYAAAAGTIHYPTLQDVQNAGITVGGDPDEFHVLELDAADDLKLFYLHLATHPRSISVNLKKSATGQDFIGMQDLRFTQTIKRSLTVQQGQLSFSGTVLINGVAVANIPMHLSGITIFPKPGQSSCIDEVIETDGEGEYNFDGLAEGFYNVRPVQSGYAFEPTAQQTVAPEGAYIAAGGLIGLSGNAGPCLSPHLHFEVQRATTVGVMDHLRKRILRFIPVDPYGWQPPTPEILDPYFRIPGLQNVGLSNETLWQVTNANPQ